MTVLPLRPSRAIRGGDVAVLARLLEAEPDLAASRLNGIAGGRTPLHIVSDWPGHFPNGPAVVALLIGAGADPNDRARTTGTVRPHCIGPPAATMSMLRRH